MTSKEIIQRTLDYEYPERVARMHSERDDVWSIYTTKTHATDWYEVGGGTWERIDEWGNTWRRIDSTSKGEIEKGVLASIDEMDTYEFPDFSKKEDYENVRKTREEHPDKWLIGSVPGMAFNVTRKLLDLEQYFMDLMLKPDHAHELHNRVDAVLETMIRRYAEAGVDSIFYPEDWGTQLSLLINPDVWKKEFLPRFERLFGLAHDLGIRVFMHSCGAIGSIIPGLMRAGVDVLQFDQPDLHGIDTLASYQEQGKITFWCPVDVQVTLQTKDEAIIREKVREMLDKLWRGRGGFISGAYPDNASIGLEPKWQEIACDEFMTYGVAKHFQNEKTSV